jgi:hypothetical protein
MLSRLTLRMRLTVLYGALFSASIVAVVATAGVIWPNFLSPRFWRWRPARAVSNAGNRST